MRWFVEGADPGIGSTVFASANIFGGLSFFSFVFPFFILSLARHAPPSKIASPCNERALVVGGGRAEWECGC